MKRKEIKNFAKKIAALELQLSKSTDMEQKSRIEKEIMTICSKVGNLDDIIAIDEEVQEILSKNS